jgi:hypothetical protein
MAAIDLSQSGKENEGNNAVIAENDKNSLLLIPLHLCW